MPTRSVPAFVRRWPTGPLTPLPAGDTSGAVPWAALQRRLAPRVERSNRFGDLRTVAGADIAFAGERAFAGIIVYSFPGLEERERVHVAGRLEFPYVPGLLSFREGPLLVEAFARLRRLPDLVMIDGQGIAHPRRLGIAAHLGLVLDRPTIGVAKSRLVGAHRTPGRRRGARARLMDGDEVIGAVLRTRDDVAPLFVSIGHRVDLDTAVRLTLRCSDGYRVPKPTRMADRYVAMLKRADRPTV